MAVRCPVMSAHVMVEVAPRLFQCPECGAGPTEFWAVGHCELEAGTVSGMCATWRQELECYTLAAVSWDVDSAGHREPTSLVSYPAGYVSTADELAKAALPVRGAGALRLRPGMFSSAFGEKTDPTTERSGRFARGLSPQEPGPSSRRRRKKEGP